MNPDRIDYFESKVIGDIVSIDDEYEFDLLKNAGWRLGATSEPGMYEIDFRPARYFSAQINPFEKIRLNKPNKASCYCACFSLGFLVSIINQNKCELAEDYDLIMEHLLEIKKHLVVENECNNN